MDAKMTIETRAASEMASADLKSYWPQNARDSPLRPSRPRDKEAEAARVPIAYTLLKTPEGALIGGCYWIEREIRVGQAPRRVAGLSGVLVEEGWRGRGLGKRLVLAASEWARGAGYAAGVLFCGEAVRDFYDKCGWSALSGPVTVRRHGEAATLWPGNILMAIALAGPGAIECWDAAPLDVGAGQW